MSLRALLLAGRDHLRQQLSLAQEQCEVGIDGQPPAYSGEWFYVVHPSGFRHQSSDDDHPDELFDFDVTITARSMRAPQDRWGSAILATATDGLIARAEALRAVVHLNYTLMNLANTEYIAGFGVTVSGFREPLRFGSCSRPQRRGGSWFGAKGGKDAGFSVTLSFNGARRIQDAATMT